MKGKISYQPIPIERVKKGYPAFFYEEGYLFDSIEEILIGKSGKGIPDTKTLVFENGKHKFPSENASELVFIVDGKTYPLTPSQWVECVDNDWHDNRDKELEFKVNKDGFAEIIIPTVELGVTGRGFALGKFKDDYGHDCSIQMSSVATRRCIWLGVDDPKPQIMASQAAQFGVHTNQTTGWVDYPIPGEVSLHTRMHLTREDVKKILPLLIRFAETGDLHE